MVVLSILLPAPSASDSAKPHPLLHNGLCLPAVMVFRTNLSSKSLQFQAARSRYHKKMAKAVLLKAKPLLLCSTNQAPPFSVAPLTADEEVDVPPVPAKAGPAEVPPVVSCEAPVPLL
jgi:hypothetical protein